MNEKKSRKLYDKRLEVRLTADELERLHQQAKKANRSLSRLLVKSALENSKVLTVEELEEVQQLRHEVRRVGINLNQIARSLNAWERGQGDQPPAMSEIEATAKEVNRVLKSLLRLIK